MTRSPTLGRPTSSTPATQMWAEDQQPGLPWEHVDLQHLSPGDEIFRPPRETRAHSSLEFHADPERGPGPQRWPWGVFHSP